MELLIRPEESDEQSRGDAYDLGTRERDGRPAPVDAPNHTPDQNAYSGECQRKARRVVRPRRAELAACQRLHRPRHTALRIHQAQQMLRSVDAHWRQARTMKTSNPYGSSWIQHSRSPNTRTGEGSGTEAQGSDARRDVAGLCCTTIVLLQ